MPTAPHHLLRRLIRLRSRDWAELLSAQAALVSAQLEVWTRPVGRLVTASSPSTTETTPAALRVTDARRLAVAIDRAAKYGAFRPKCLVRAIALHRMLAARGIEQSLIRIGVRQQNGEFAAHAWVEYGNLVLGDRETHTRTFAQLSDIRPMDTQ